MEEHNKKIAANLHQRKRLTKAVDIIKLIFFNLMADYYFTRFDNIKPIKEFSITVVNEMFSCHNDKTLMIWAEHKEEIEQGIAHLKQCNPDLIIPFTDALTVSLEAQTLEAGRPPSLPPALWLHTPLVWQPCPSGPHRGCPPG